METHHRPALNLAAPPERAKENLSDEVVRRLTTAIALGEYLPGSQLPPERQLATLLGVGRVTIRAAIGRLVDAGLLQSRRGGNGGTFVVERNSAQANAIIERTLSEAWDRLVDLQEAEAWMHGVIAEAAAQRRTEEDLAAIAARLEGFREATSGPAAQKADELFHDAIIRATHNRSLAELIHSLERQVHVSAPAHPWGAARYWEAMEKRALADHEKIFAAIKDADSARARDEGRRHAQINHDHLVDALRDARQAIESDATDTSR